MARARVDRVDLEVVARLVEGRVLEERVLLVRARALVDSEVVARVLLDRGVVDLAEVARGVVGGALVEWALEARKVLDRAKERVLADRVDLEVVARLVEARGVRAAGVGDCGALCNSRVCGRVCVTSVGLGLTPSIPSRLGW
ncbi:MULTISPECIES: hypothetical protein [Helicobacter]|uniref:hypothetical protein n=1 Tax=Helicobacter TaxID=209 RepID=UPI0013CDEA47|nr:MULTISPECIES: hypothetical protein [Helicobacter]